MKPETKEPEAKPPAREAPPRRTAARPTMDPEPQAEPAAKERDVTPARREQPKRTAARPSEDSEPEAKPARREKPTRTAARPVADPEPEVEPDVEEPAAKPSRRGKPERARSAAREKPPVRAAARSAPALVSPEVTGSIARSSPVRLQARAPAARPIRDARRQASDIPVIALPDVLRPTRPPAGSPL